MEEEQKVLQESELEPSLSECVQRWLERTPGLEENGFNFPAKFKAAVDSIFDLEIANIEVFHTVKAYMLLKMSSCILFIFLVF